KNPNTGITTYTWNDANLLTGINAAGALTTHLYDARGLRRRLDGGGQTSIYLWDQQNLLLEQNASLVIQAHYVQLPGVFGAPSSQRRSGASIFYGLDLLRNT